MQSEHVVRCFKTPALDEGQASRVARPSLPQIAHWDSERGDRALLLRKNGALSNWRSLSRKGKRPPVVEVMPLT
jgi:hypothetical protein